MICRNYFSAQSQQEHKGVTPKHNLQNTIYKTQISFTHVYILIFYLLKHPTFN